MILALLCALLAAEDRPRPALPGRDATAFFESRVRPTLVEHCWKCHGPSKAWGGLRVDSRESLLRGGDSGAAILPGKPDESLLIRAVRHVDDELKMPQGGKLSDRQIGDLAQWIEQGAPFPKSAALSTPNRDPQHWAFQPPAAPPLSVVRNVDWPHTTVDQYILVRLEQAAMQPAAPADRRTLVRRVTYDLTGLPPTTDEMDAFVADESPDAYPRLVDRLLAAPTYGERWGRHWLDVARYADSNGLDENIAHGNAWRYRDYVVAAFNHDKPFDQFVVEQLAGDLLAAADQDQRHERLIATGFLAIGPKVLAEVDQAKMQGDIIDEQISSVGRTFLGLTLGCARCHDHKFDPIDAADYYGLAGIFKSTRTMETYTKVARWHEHLLPSPEATAIKAAYDARMAAKKRAVNEFVAATNKQVLEKHDPNSKPPEKLETLYSAEAQAELKKLRDELAAIEKDPPELASAMSVTEDQVADVAIQLRGNPLKLGDIVARRTPNVLRGPPQPQFATAESGRRQLAEWLIDPEHPLTSRVIVNRVYRWHFGHGLVRTIDNFGLLGEPPTHPELLDWLARRFVADGWSLKSLHRTMLHSSTYQQSSSQSPERVASDPENRLFGRASVRRLTAEEIRDSLLAVSGQLDATIGGSLLKVKNRGYLFDHTSIDTTDYTSRRRSLYLPVIRNNVYDLFQLLDFPDPAVPNGDRAMTTVAPQALLMLNSEFVMQSAAELAERVLAEPGDDPQHVSRMVTIAYGRLALPAEIQANREFLSRTELAIAATVPDDAARRRQAWAVLCQVILAANEFVYLQ